MSSNDVAIRVENLSKRYEIYAAPRDRLKQFVLPRLQRFAGRPSVQYFREFWALKDVSLEVKKGETVGIIGRNGSGKSTLLQMICGTLTPTNGSIQTIGRIAALLELGSGFNPEFTGRENVYMNAAVLGLSQEEVDGRFEEIAAFADIGQFIEQPVKTYSSGMVVRLAFAVAINVDPEILIVDEALSVGDELFQRKCFSRIAAIRANGATILFVSHSGGTIVQLCDRAVLLDAGGMLATGLPKQIVGRYQRLLYAPDDKREIILREFKEGQILSGDHHEVDDQSIYVNKEESDEYDDNLISTSKIEYQSIGAKICDVHIKNSKNRKVNILVHGNKYRYCYRVEFSDNALNVGFGMAIKTISGIDLFGQGSHNITDGLKLVKSGDIVEVEFEFSNLLMPGTYFGNAGVSIHDGSVKQIHRILDAIVFKVKNTEFERPVSCLVNLKPRDSIPVVKLVHLNSQSIR